MSGRTRTQRGRSGKKWVGLNYKEKERAKEANGGPMPYTLSLVTSDFPHKSEWSQIDLPDILFYIQPPISEYEGVKVENLIEDGKPVASDATDGHIIRQFEILPRNISLDVPGWLVEAWRRLDTRIGYQDILDRQYADPNLGLKKHTKNALQNHCRRECRKVLNTWVEYGRRDEPHRTEVEAIEGLSYENIQLNTTLKRSHMFSNRLVKVRLERRVEDGLYYAIPREVTIENWRDTTLPLDHFLQDSQALEMTPSMHAAWGVYLLLMERAAVHGHGHWSKLDRSCLPVTWYDRTPVKSVPNDTYDGGCAACTWSLDRVLPASPDIKLEPGESSSTTKANKRRRSESRAEMWELGDTPKAPKRRYATRLSSQGRSSESRGTNCDSSPVIEGVTFVETYRRNPHEYDYYSISPNGKLREHSEGDLDDDLEEGSLSNDGAGDDCSEYEGDEDEEVEEDEDTASPYPESDPLSTDDEEVDGVVRDVEADDPFRAPSATRSNSYRQVQIAADSLSSPPRSSSQARAWLRSSNLRRSESLPQGFDHSPSSSIEDTTLLHTELDEIPAYLPASAFYNHHSLDPAIFTQAFDSSNLRYESSFKSVTALPGTSFSSNDARLPTAAPSFTEVSHTAIDQYHPLPNSASVGFPTDQFYPLPMTQSQAAFKYLSYPSPPHTASYQNQMSFKSSPPRRPESEWEWTQHRPRRHSDTDATMGLPSDFAEFGAFEHDLTAISSYLADQEFGETLELPPIAPANEYASSHTFESDDFENGEVAVEGTGIEDAAVGRMIGSNFEDGFPEEQMNLTTAPLSVI